MRTQAELTELAAHGRNEALAQLPDVGTFFIMWNYGLPITPIGIAGQAESSRDMPRMLREIADSLEKQKDEKIIKV